MTRADEGYAAGLSDGVYLVGYTADEVINWSFDEKGEFEWVVIRTSCLRQDSVRSFSVGRKRHAGYLL